MRDDRCVMILVLSYDGRGVVQGRWRDMIRGLVKALGKRQWVYWLEVGRLVMVSARSVGLRERGRRWGWGLGGSDGEVAVGRGIRFVDGRRY